MSGCFHWDPRDYAASSASQARWGRELMQRVGWRGDEHVLDVGCGDGRLTAELARLVPGGAVLGVDRSSEMIAHAQGTYPPAAHANLRFQQQDACSLALSSEYDVVFSNAALHWVADHRAFLSGAARALRSGGQLVVSCGGQGNADEVFSALRVEMRTPAWRAFFRKLEKPYFFYSDEDYREWLPEAGFTTTGVRLIPKEAVHPHRGAFAAWLRTTWMPYTQRVPEGRRGSFIEAVVQRYLAAHPADASGGVRVRMVRLEIDAVRV